MAKITSGTEDMAALPNLFQQEHKDLRKTIITVGQGGYNAAVNNVYSSVIHQAFPQDQQATYNLGQIIQGISDQQNQISKFA